MPDNNGEVWAGVLNGRQIVRLDPRSERWTVYQMPEPYAYDRRTWIDNSTHPVTLWYVDYNGVLVRSNRWTSVIPSLAANKISNRDSK